MISTMSRLTAFDVSDPVRPWGKIRDFLVEFPSIKMRYFSVDAHVGVGVKEIWAPLECINSVDSENMALTVKEPIDKKMVRHLSRLEEPEQDHDELRLHRLYQTSPDWVEIRRKKGGPLRKHSRLVRGSELLGYEARTRSGTKGWVRDLLFDDRNLCLKMLRIQFDDAGLRTTVDMEAGHDCQLYPQNHVLYIDMF